MSYKISIILPVFNVEEYIDKAFNSILYQTIGFNNLEVIFVDDCSTDNSGKIIDYYSDKYDNVISVHLEMNSGAAGKPRNVGIEYVNSDYIMFLDPDDVFTNNACEILYNKALNNNVDIVGGLLTLFDANGVKHIDSNYVFKTFTDINEKKEIRLEKTNNILNNPNFELKIESYKELNSVISMFHFCTKLFKTDFIRKNNIKFAEFAPAEDSIFLLKAIFNANGMVFVNDVIIEYFNIRTGNNKSVSHQISKKRFFERIGVYYKMYDLSKTAGEEELFIKYLLINKLNYFLSEHLGQSRLPNEEKREILNFVSPLFKECLLFKEYIPYNLKLFKLIANDIDKAIIEFNRINKSKRSNNIFTVVININDSSISNLNNCLNNIITQTYTNLQIICVINKLDGEIYEFVKNYPDERILVVENESNDSWVYLGLENSIGQYIHFINVDNYFDNSFYTAVQELFNDEIDMVLCNSDSFELNNFNVKNKNEFNFNNLPSIFNISRDISNQIYKTTFLDQHYNELFKEEIFFEDIFCYNYYLNVNKAIYSPNIFCHENKNIHISKINPKDYFSEYIYNFKFIINTLLSNENYNLYEEEIWQNIMFNLLKILKNIENNSLKEYYILISDFFNEYELLDKKFSPQLELWLNLFKKENYNLFKHNMDKLFD